MTPDGSHWRSHGCWSNITILQHQYVRFVVLLIGLLFADRFHLVHICCCSVWLSCVSCFDYNNVSALTILLYVAFTVLNIFVMTPNILKFTVIVDRTSVWSCNTMLYLGCSCASSYMGRMVQYFDVCVYPCFTYITCCAWCACFTGFAHITRISVDWAWSTRVQNLLLFLCRTHARAWGKRHIVVYGRTLVVA